MVTRDEVKATLLDNGWEDDRWGNLKKLRVFTRRDTNEKITRLCRIKLGARVIRYEFQVNLDTGKEWMKLSGGYYSKLVIDAQGNLRLGVHILNR